MQVINKYNLKDNYYESGWGEVHRVGSNLKWTPTDKDPDGKRAALRNMRNVMSKRQTQKQAHYAKHLAAIEAKRKEIIDVRLASGRMSWLRRMRSNAQALSDDCPPAVAALIKST